jgi:hypothetical protein
VIRAVIRNDGRNQYREDKMSDSPEQFANWLCECGIETLQFKKLHADDREGIQWAMLYLGTRVISPDPEVQRACHLLMMGAYLIGAHANASKSAKIYQDEIEHGKIGKKTGAAARELAEKWRAPARQRIIVDFDRVRR